MIRGLRWIAVNILPGLAISIAAFIVLAIAAEFVLRVETPFLEVNWPTRFDPRFGFNFVPGAIVQWTNHTDFWTKTRANSLGFLDREPPAAAFPDNNECRIAFIGDSFVEAAQLPIEQKIQSQIEQLAQQQGFPKTVRAMSFGYSGTGQANQIPFYDVFARNYHPNIVVLVFASNDFANNSTILESIRNGWDPFHPPRLFYDRDRGGRFRPIEIDPEWAAKLLPTSPPPKNWRTAAHKFLDSHSYAYNWVYTRLSLNYPKIARRLDGNTPWNDTYSGWMRSLTQRWPEIDLSGWDFPDDWDMDFMFFTETLPPVFQEALALTGHALDEFAERARDDHFNLVILADKYLHNSASSGSTPAERANPLLQDGGMRRLNALTAERHIPVVDFFQYITSIGHQPGEANFTHDGHWTPHGHRWAAEAVFNYLRQHPETCDRASGSSTPPS